MTLIFKKYQKSYKTFWVSITTPRPRGRTKEHCIQAQHLHHGVPPSSCDLSDPSEEFSWDRVLLNRWFGAILEEATAPDWRQRDVWGLKCVSNCNTIKCQWLKQHRIWNQHPAVCYTCIVMLYCVHLDFSKSWKQTTLIRVESGEKSAQCKLALLVQRNPAAPASCSKVGSEENNVAHWTWWIIFSEFYNVGLRVSIWKLATAVFQCRAKACQKTVNALPPNPVCQRETHEWNTADLGIWSIFIWLDVEPCETLMKKWLWHSRRRQCLMRSLLQ